MLDFISYTKHRHTLTYTHFTQNLTLNPNIASAQAARVHAHALAHSHTTPLTQRHTVRVHVSAPGSVQWPHAHMYLLSV